MSQSKLDAARQLISERRYVLARRLLRTLPDDADKHQLLAELNQVQRWGDGCVNAAIIVLAITALALVGYAYWVYRVESIPNPALPPAGGYTTIDPGELVANADNHLGEHVRVTGTVFNIIDATIFQMWVGSNRAPVSVRTRDQSIKVTKGEAVTILGIVDGYVTFQDGLGGTARQPMLRDAITGE